MATKHKVLKDFQLLTDDKKILILKAKTIIEDYKFKTKTEMVNVPSDIIRNNPEYFSYIDWKEELQSYLKTNKIPQPAVITKKLVPFIEELMDEVSVKETIKEREVIKEVIVEKPKIIEKEVIVEKPTIIEKIVNDQSLIVELENKLKKLELKESQLDREIDENNLKEISLTNKEKELLDIEKNLKEREILVKSQIDQMSLKEMEIAKREEKVVFKENNLSAFADKSQINHRMSQLESKGFNVSLFREIMDGL